MVKTLIARAMLQPSHPVPKKKKLTGKLFLSALCRQISDIPVPPPSLFRQYLHTANTDTLQEILRKV
jgi:hypothetical protein